MSNENTDKQDNQPKDNQKQKAPKALPAFEVREDGANILRRANGLTLVNYPGEPR